MARVTTEDRQREILFGSGLRRINISQLARKVGVSRRTLSSYREHPGKIPLATLRLIVAALDISPDELAGLF